MSGVIDAVALPRGQGAHRPKAGARAAVPTAAPGWRRYLREPFFHFLILGGGLFFFSHWLEQRSRFTRIEITQDVVRALAQNYHLQYGRDPTSSQLEAMVQGHIREEVLYHEAHRLGLDQEDEIVRRRLVQKYEFLQQDLTIAADPTDAELRAYFASHEANYRKPETVAFSHVYFSVDRRGEDEARAAAATEVAKLISTGRTRAADAGDVFPGPQDFPALSAEEAERVFGRSVLTESLLHLEAGRWSTPLRSAYGWHVIHVDSYTPSRSADFAAVKDQVRRDYLEDARTARNEADYARLRKNFEIVRE